MPAADANAGEAATDSSTPVEAVPIYGDGRIVVQRRGRNYSGACFRRRCRFDGSRRPFHCTRLSRARLNHSRGFSGCG